MLFLEDRDGAASTRKLARGGYARVAAPDDDRIHVRREVVVGAGRQRDVLPP
jgi:hypothetical protein